MNGLKRTFLCASLLVVPSMGPAQDLDLNVPGASSELRSELKDAMSMLSLLDAGDATPQSLIAAAQADYARLVAALYQGGRFSPAISIKIDGREAAGLSPFEAPSSINQILVEIDPGPKFRFGRADIAPLAEGTVLPETFRTGERAGTRPITDASRTAIDAWRQIGHAKAKLSDQQIVANHPNRALDVRIGLEPGPRLRFGDMIVAGNEGVRRSRIQEIAGIPKGEVFDPDEISGAERRLRETGVFASVAISEAETPNPDDTLDLSIQVADRKPRRFGFGAEVSSQEGGKLSAFWLHRNFFGGAERFRIDGEIGGLGTNDGDIDYSLELSYGRPSTFTRDTEFYLNAGIERLEEPAYTSNEAHIASGLVHRFSDTLTGSFELGYQYIDTEDAFGDRTFNFVTATVGAVYNTRDDDLNPTRGFYIDAKGTPFLGLGDTTSGFRFTSDARTYYGLGADNKYVLAGRAQLGSIWGPSLAETGPDYLFFSGGGGTVRGQAYQSLGVTTDSGDFTGGQSFAAVSAELRAMVRDNIGLVGFYDVGFVTEESGFAGESDWHAGAGVGLRYITGIGAIRVDLATQASGENAGQNLEIYIGIGQAF